MSTFININQNKTNPYISDVTFPKAENEVTLMVQQQKFQEFLISLIKNPYIQSDSKAVATVNEDMLNNPQSYPISRTIFVNSLISLNKAIPTIYSKISKGIYNSNIFEYGYCFINDNFYDDIVEKRINRIYFVNMIYQISNSLQKFI